MWAVIKVAKAFVLITAYVDLYDRQDEFFIK